VADLTANGLSATARVEQLGGADGFAEYWRTLATDWRGWKGDRTWESSETELAFSASSDRTGHVHLTVRLQDRALYHWRVQARLTLESGQLDRIASNATEFARLFGAAA